MEQASSDIPQSYLELAGAVEARGMREAAIFLLLAHAPLAGLVSAGMHVVRPLLVALVGNAQASALAQLFSSPGEITRFVELLERRRERP